MPDESHKSPKFADEQAAPLPERPTTPLEDAGQDIASLDDPPKAEGDRDEAEVEDAGRRRESRTDA